MSDNNGTYVSRYDDNEIYGYNIFKQAIQVPSLQSSSTLQLNAPDGLIVGGSVGVDGQILVSQGLNNPPQWRTVSGASTTLSALVAQNSSCGNLPLSQCSGIESTDAFNLVANAGLNVGNGVGTVGQVLTSNGSSEPTWTSVSGSSKTLGQLVTENPSCNDLPFTHCTGVDSTTTLELIAPDGLKVNGTVGTNDQVLVSQGVGLTPKWKTILETQTLTSILDTSTSAGFNPITDVIGIESQSQLTVVAPTGIQLNSTVGTSGQYLGSNGSAQPTWKTLPTTTLSGIISQSSSCGNQGLTDIPSVTSANTFTITAPQGLSVGGSVGVSGQVLTSRGSSAPASWVTPVSNATTLSGLIGENSNCGNQTLTNLRGINNTDGGSLLFTAPNGIGLNGTVGSSGQVFTSNGASYQPTWQTISSGTSTLAQLVASNSSCGGGTLTQCIGISSDNNIALASPSGLLLNGQVGTTNQVLSSNGAAQPTWKTVSVSPTLQQVLTNGNSANNNVINNLLGIGGSSVAISADNQINMFAPTGVQLNGTVGSSGQYFGSLGASQPRWTTLPTFSEILTVNNSAGNKTITHLNEISAVGGLSLSGTAGVTLSAGIGNVSTSNAMSVGSLSSTGAITTSGNITASGIVTGNTVSGSVSIITPSVSSTTISNSGSITSGSLTVTGSASFQSTFTTTGTVTGANFSTVGNISCGGLLTGNTMTFNQYGNPSINGVGGINYWSNSKYNFDFPLTYSTPSIIKTLGNDTGIYVLDYSNSSTNPTPDGLVVSVLNSTTNCSVVLGSATNGQKVSMINYSRCSGTNNLATTGCQLVITATVPMYIKSSNSGSQGSGTPSIYTIGTPLTLVRGVTVDCQACGTYWNIIVNNTFF